MAMQLHQKRCQLPMHPLRLQIVPHVDHEDVVEETIEEEEVRLEADDHDVVDDKNERSQNLSKKSSVSDE
jgi:hypothetical protein